jgi:hypothetical protein
MGSKGAAIITLLIVGVIIADIVANGTKAQAAANGVASIQKPWINGLLGQTTK